MIAAEVDVVDRTRGRIKVSVPEGGDTDTEHRSVDGTYVLLSSYSVTFQSVVCL